jgi:hypothetical protein
MALKHGRFANRPSDRSSDPGADTVNTTPGFKVTRRGPGVERLMDTGRGTRDARLVAQEELKAQLSNPHAPVKPPPKVQSEPPVGATVTTVENDKYGRTITTTTKILGPDSSSYTVDISDPPTPEQKDRLKADLRAERHRLLLKEAHASVDPMLDVRYNESLHLVKTPGGLAKYHADRQRTALEMAKELKGKDRKFALALAKQHGAAKRAAQKRVPAGQPTGGRWTK